MNTFEYLKHFIGWFIA